MDFKNNLINRVKNLEQSVLKKRESLVNDRYNSTKYAGMLDALERYAIQINGIQESNISLVPPERDIIGVPQYLTTDNKFLNTAYFYAKIIRDNPRENDGSSAGSPAGEEGKRIVMNQIMNYIKSIS